MNIKPVTHYLRDDFADDIEVGEYASVFAVDHYRLGQTLVQTTRVVNYDRETGVFETRNTIYKPLDIQSKSEVQ
jgi:hypothetical protein